MNFFKVNFFQFWEVVSDEHRVDADGNFIGDSDVQLQSINVFFKQVRGELLFNYY